MFSCAVFSVCSKRLWVSSAVFVVSSNYLWALARFSSVTSLFFFKVASCSSRAALARRSASSCYRRSLSVDEADFEEHPDCRPEFFRNVFDMELSSVRTTARCTSLVSPVLELIWQDLKASTASSSSSSVLGSTSFLFCLWYIYMEH